MRLPEERNGTAALAALTAAGIMSGLGVWAMRKRTRPRFSFAGRTIIITGGARGLGLGLARQLGSEGAEIVLVSRTAEELERAARDLQTKGARVRWFPCDIRDPAAVQTLVDDVVNETGRLDVLINNAGIIQSMPFGRTTNEDFAESLDTHFWGPLHLIRAALPHLQKSEGRIVNISSIGGRIAVPHLLPYCVGKFAVTALSDGLHAELAPRGISVLTVTPGLMRTGSHRNVKVRGHHVAEARMFALADATPLTSMNVERAARKIVEACRRRRARITPGRQARAAEILNALAPELTSAAMARAAALLPGEGPAAGDQAIRSRDLQLGWLSKLFPTGAAVRMNQPVAADEARGWRARRP
jgi:NAD(P)-dependent dehydrogenase (short-subunit alcohol dehydrogenase family)